MQNPDNAALIERADGTSGFLLLCDHASNHMPEEFGGLGLGAAALADHIAWDPGALPVMRMMSERMDAPMIAACQSRLLIDMNRPEGAAGSIVEVSDGQEIHGNRGLSAEEKRARFERFHIPYHSAVENLLDVRGDSLRAIIAIHSFTPVHSGKTRPWHIGVLHNGESGIAGPMIAELSAEDGLVVGENEPYSPADDVYYSLERHAVSRGLDHVMIEIRNDVIADASGQAAWARRLGDILSKI
jgi:predicted N-formylglutamate amidohydrolase